MLYGDDGELTASVRNFLGQGLADGGSVVVVATPAHRAAFAAALAPYAAAEGGTATEGSTAGGPPDRLLMADAAGMLSGFLGGDRLDAVRFRTAAVDLIGRAASAGQPVRIYAEMVALLWDAGRVTQALELESLWNDLAAQLPLRLLCAYPARLMSGPDGERGLDAVRRLHTRVVRPHPDAIARRGPPAGGSVTGGAREVVWGFPPHLDSAREARHFVLSQLGSRADRALVADAAIVIAELAANAVVHARSTFTVAVSHPGDSAPGDTVRIAVRDMAPLGVGQHLVTATGHGLDVVAKIARRWAIEPLPDGKVIWVELSGGERLST